MVDIDRIGYLPIPLVSKAAKPSMAVELSDTFQPLDGTLTALAGLDWTAGKQVPVFTADDTVSFVAVGEASATDLIDRAAGDTRYAANGSGVLTFNTRAGAVTLLSADVTTALGFTPYNASNPSGYISSNQTITVTGDATGSGSTSVTLTLATVNSNVGTFGSSTQVAQVTVNGKGLVTAVTAVTITPPWSAITGKPTNLSGYGITDALKSGESLTLGIRTMTATGSVAATDHTILADTTSGAITVNLPAVASSSGRVLIVKKIDVSVNVVTLDGNASETIDGATTLAIGTQWDAYTIQCNGSAWFRI